MFSRNGIPCPFRSLRTNSNRIFYYSTRQGNEVNCICIDDQDNNQLVQVCWDLDDEKTRCREIKSLKQTMNETGLKEGTIVTCAQEDHIQEEHLNIHVVPGWKFFLK